MWNSKLWPESFKFDFLTKIINKLSQSSRPGRNFANDFIATEIFRRWKPKPSEWKISYGPRLNISKDISSIVYTGREPYTVSPCSSTENKAVILSRYLSFSFKIKGFTWQHSLIKCSLMIFINLCISILFFLNSNCQLCRKFCSISLAFAWEIPCHFCQHPNQPSETYKSPSRIKFA